LLVKRPLAPGTAATAPHARSLTMLGSAHSLSTCAQREREREREREKDTDTERERQREREPSLQGVNRERAGCSFQLEDIPWEGEMLQQIF